MALTAIIHTQGEDAFAADLDEVPNPNHTFVLLRNMRKKDGKQLAYLADDTKTVLYAWHKITFMELIGEAAASASTVTAKPAGTTVLGFFRDDDD